MNILKEKWFWVIGMWFLVFFGIDFWTIASLELGFVFGFIGTKFLDFK